MPNEPEDDVAEVVDVLPAELDATASGRLYEFPNNSKRRVAAILHCAVGAICLLVALAVDSPRVNDGLLAAGIGLMAFAVYSYVVGSPTVIDEGDALVIAAATVGFTAGPASAQMVWRGWRSRPAWRVLLYSAEPQPLQRGIVVVDGVDGHVIEHLVEDNPEDWSAF